MMSWQEHAINSKTNEKGEVVQLGLVGLYGIVQTIEVMLAQQGKSMWSEDFGSTTLADPDTRKAIEYYLDLQQNGGMESPLNPANTYYTWFIEGKAAMFNYGYWIVSQMSNEQNWKIDVNDVELVPVRWNKTSGFRHVWRVQGRLYTKTPSIPTRLLRFSSIYISDRPPIHALKGIRLPIDRTKTSLLPQDTLPEMAYESVLTTPNMPPLM